MSCGKVPLDRTLATAVVDPIFILEELERVPVLVFEPVPPLVTTPPLPVDGAEVGKDPDVFPCDGTEAEGILGATLLASVASKVMLVTQVGCPGREARSVKLIGKPFSTGVSIVSTWIRVPLGLPAHRVMKLRGTAVFPICANTAT